MSNEKVRSSCEALLRTLCKAIHTGQTIKMPFCLHRGFKRHVCGAIVGKEVVFISVHENGIVDLSELRVWAHKNATARLWLHHIDMKFECKGFDLLELLRWSVTSAFPHMRRKGRRKTLCIQLVWNIGRVLERFILMNLNAEGVSEVDGLRLECESSPNADHRCGLPLTGCQETSALTTHSNAPWSTGLLVERADLSFLRRRDYKQQKLKDKAIRKAASLKHTMKYDLAGQAPLLMKRQAGKNATERPAKRSRQAASQSKSSSENKMPGRLSKKSARGRS